MVGPIYRLANRFGRYLHISIRKLDISIGIGQKTDIGQISAWRIICNCDVILKEYYKLNVNFGVRFSKESIFGVSDLGKDFSKIKDTLNPDDLLHGRC